MSAAAEALAWVLLVALRAGVDGVALPLLCVLAALFGPRSGQRSEMAREGVLYTLAVGLS